MSRRLQELRRAVDAAAQDATNTAPRPLAAESPPWRPPSGPPWRQRAHPADGLPSVALNDIALRGGRAGWRPAPLAGSFILDAPQRPAAPATAPPPPPPQQPPPQKELKALAVVDGHTVLAVAGAASRPCTPHRGALPPVLWGGAAREAPAQEPGRTEPGAGGVPVLAPLQPLLRHPAAGLQRLPPLYRALNFNSYEAEAISGLEDGGSEASAVSSESSNSWEDQTEELLSDLPRSTVKGGSSPSLLPLVGVPPLAFLPVAIYKKCGPAALQNVFGTEGNCVVGDPSAEANSSGSEGEQSPPPPQRREWRVDSGMG